MAHPSQQHYFGTKRINARPMNRADYNTLRGWELPANECGTDAGYLVEYLDGGKPNHADFKGYISWSPAEQFEAAYKQNGRMNFGHALDALKDGEMVARAGWNGKGMWLAYSPGCRDLPAEKFWAGPNRDYANDQPNSVADVLPCITMKTATGEILMGWLASQSDMLAEDWSIVSR